MLWLDVVLKGDNVGFVAYSNHALVAKPLGLTSPLRTPMVAELNVAGFVVTVGLDMRGVVKLIISPFDVPAELVADTRK